MMLFGVLFRDRFVSFASFFWVKYDSFVLGLVCSGVWWKDLIRPGFSVLEDRC